MIYNLVREFRVIKANKISRNVISSAFISNILQEEHKSAFPCWLFRWKTARQGIITSKQQDKHLHKTVRCGISFPHFPLFLLLLVEKFAAFGKYYFWKFELIIDSMSSVCPELLAHLSGFRFGFLATEVTPFSSFLLAFQHVSWFGASVSCFLWWGMEWSEELATDRERDWAWIFGCCAVCCCPRLILCGRVVGFHRPLNFKVNFRSSTCPIFLGLCGRHIVLTAALCNPLLGSSSNNAYCFSCFPASLSSFNSRCGHKSLSFLPSGWDILLGQRLLGRCLPYMSCFFPLAPPFFFHFLLPISLHFSTDDYFLACCSRPHVSAIKLMN